MSLSDWQQVDVNKWIQQHVIKLFYEMNFDMYFLLKTLSKWNKWKLIIEDFSKVYTYILHKHIKFEITWKKWH
jgi:hypothetical protein